MQFWTWPGLCVNPYWTIYDTYTYRYTCRIYNNNNISNIKYNNTILYKLYKYTYPYLFKITFFYIYIYFFLFLPLNYLFSQLFDVGHPSPILPLISISRIRFTYLKLSYITSLQIPPSFRPSYSHLPLSYTSPTTFTVFVSFFLNTYLNHLNLFFLIL